MKTRNTPPSTVPELRAEVSALYAEAAGTQSAGPTRPEAEADITAQVHAAFNSPDAERVRSLVAAGMTHQAFALEHRRPPQVAHNVLAMLAVVIGPDRLAEALHTHVSHLPDGRDATARSARLGAIRTELDSLERQEEVLIDASELTAQPIPRRADARPEIILAVRP